MTCAETGEGYITVFADECFYFNGFGFFDKFGYGSEFIVRSKACVSMRGVFVNVAGCRVVEFGSCACIGSVKKFPVIAGACFNFIEGFAGYDYGVDRFAGKSEFRAFKGISRAVLFKNREFGYISSDFVFGGNADGFGGNGFIGVGRRKRN